MRLRSSLLHPRILASSHLHLSVGFAQQRVLLVQDAEAWCEIAFIDVDLLRFWL